MKKHTWYVTFEIPWRGTAVRSRRSRSTQTFESEAEAKNLARAKFDDGLVVTAVTVGLLTGLATYVGGPIAAAAIGLAVTAGTIVPHLPKRAIPSGSIPAWLEEGQDQATAAPSDNPGTVREVK